MAAKPKNTDEIGRQSDGKFGVGNPGKPKGARSERVILWEQLKDYVVSEGAERAMQAMQSLDDEQFLEAYMKMLEYFKPKQARVSHVGEEGASPIQIVISDKI